MDRRRSRSEIEGLPTLGSEERSGPSENGATRPKGAVALRPRYRESQRGDSDSSETTVSPSAETAGMPSGAQELTVSDLPFGKAVCPRETVAVSCDARTGRAVGRAMEPVAGEGGETGEGNKTGQFSAMESAVEPAIATYSVATAVALLYWCESSDSLHGRAG